MTMAIGSDCERDSGHFENKKEIFNCLTISGAGASVSERTIERCEQMSEWTSEGPSACVLMFIAKAKHMAMS